MQLDGRLAGWLAGVGDAAAWLAGWLGQQWCSSLLQQSVAHGVAWLAGTAAAAVGRLL
jgi:membrane protein YqaA with SNARE-associated domain